MLQLWSLHHELSVMTSGILRLQYHMNTPVNYSVVRIAPRVAAFLCSISSSSERGSCERRVARVSATERFFCVLATFCTCIVRGSSLGEVLCSLLQSLQSSDGIEPGCSP